MNSSTVAGLAITALIALMLTMWGLSSVNQKATHLTPLPVDTTEVVSDSAKADTMSTPADSACDTVKLITR